MSNPNIVNVFAPDGEMFEMTRVNARDLCTHAGWSMTRPDVIKTAPAAEPEEEDHASNEREGSREDGEGTSGEAGRDEAETTGEASGEGQEEVLTESGPAFFTTAEEFDHLETREAVVEYLAEKFPDFRPHHKSSRDGLIAKAIELAASE